MNVYTVSHDRFGHLQMELCGNTHVCVRSFGASEAARQHQQVRRSRLDKYRKLASAGRPLFGKVKR